jgi:hypothetical protein
VNTANFDLVVPAAARDPVIWAVLRPENRRAMSARIAEMVLRDERTVIPIGSFQRAFGVTLWLQSVVGRVGVISVLQLISCERARGHAQSLRAGK